MFESVQAICLCAKHFEGFAIPYSFLHKNNSDQVTFQSQEPLKGLAKTSSGTTAMENNVYIWNWNVTLLSLCLIDRALWRAVAAGESISVRGVGSCSALYMGLPQQRRGRKACMWGRARLQFRQGRINH